MHSSTNKEEYSVTKPLNHFTDLAVQFALLESISYYIHIMRRPIGGQSENSNPRNHSSYKLL
jgi:hypothetical protein